MMLGGYINMAQENVNYVVYASGKWKAMSEMGESAERFLTRVANQTKQKGKRRAAKPTSR